MELYLTEKVRLGYNRGDIVWRGAGTINSPIHIVDISSAYDQDP